MADSSPSLPLYSPQEWRIAALLLVSYMGVAQITALYVPSSVFFYPASAIALAGLFFGGVRLWPVVFLASVLAGLALHLPLAALALFPAAETAAVALGAYLLRTQRLDPLFRRYRDSFLMMLTSALISFIEPLSLLAAKILSNLPITYVDFWHSYTSTLCCFLVITPFLLRWFAKSRFYRTPLELIETCIVFAIVIAKKYNADMADIASFNGLETGDTLNQGDVLVIPGGEVTQTPEKKKETKTTSKTTKSTSKIHQGGGLTSIESAGGSADTDGYFSNPVPGALLTQGIHGWNGVDLGAPSGTPIYAAAAGTVIVSRASGWNGGYGNYVVIRVSVVSVSPEE
jgi:LysM repeat protein